MYYKQYNSSVPSAITIQDLSGQIFGCQIEQFRAHDPKTKNTHLVADVGLLGEELGEALAAEARLALENGDVASGVALIAKPLRKVDARWPCTCTVGVTHTF